MRKHKNNNVCSCNLSDTETMEVLMPDGEQSDRDTGTADGY